MRGRAVAGAGHRRQHHDLQPVERAAAPAAAGPRPGAPRHRVHERLQRAALRRVLLSRLPGFPDAEPVLRRPGRVRGPAGRAVRRRREPAGARPARERQLLRRDRAQGRLRPHRAAGRGDPRSASRRGREPRALAEPLRRGPGSRRPQGRAQRAAVHGRGHRTRGLRGHAARSLHGRLRAARDAPGAHRGVARRARQPRPDADRPPAPGRRDRGRAGRARTRRPPPSRQLPRLLGQPALGAPQRERAAGGRLARPAPDSRPRVGVPRRAVRRGRPGAAHRLLERREPAAGAGERPAARDRGADRPRRPARPARAPAPGREPAAVVRRGGARGRPRRPQPAADPRIPAAAARSRSPSGWSSTAGCCCSRCCSRSRRASSSGCGRRCEPRAPARSSRSRPAAPRRRGGVASRRAMRWSSHRSPGRSCS